MNEKDDISMPENNPFELRVSAGHIGAYGSYSSGLPVYNVSELEQQYSYLKEFAKWAVENKVCTFCRFPWTRGNYNNLKYIRCECGKYKTNKRDINLAQEAAESILEYDRIKTLELAARMEEELKGDSEYAQLNRKSRSIMKRRIERYYKEMGPSKKTIKKTLSNLFYSSTKWLRPSYWKWRFFTPESEKSNTIPLCVATEEVAKEMSFGNRKVQSGNVCIRTKSGAVVVAPTGMVESLRGKYKGAVVVAPAIKE